MSGLNNIREAYNQIYSQINENHMPLDEAEKPLPYGRMMKKSDELADSEDKKNRKRAAKIYLAANSPKGPKVKYKVDEAKSPSFEVRKSSGAGALTKSAASQLGPKAVELQKKKAAAVDLPKMKNEELEFSQGRMRAMLDEAKKEKTLRNSNPCWKGYEPVGTKQKGGRTVPNCVPKEEVELVEKAPPGAKYERMVKHIKKGYSKDGLTDKERSIAFATAWKSYNKQHNEEYLLEKARGTRKKSTVHAYDVDETLFAHGKKGKPNVKVHVKDASGKRVKSLSNQEFNTHKLEKGHSYDFGEFQSAKKFKETSSPNKKVVKHIQKKVARGENVHLITARSKFDNPKEFHGHLKKHGIDVPLKNIHYTGGMKGKDIGDKKVAVANAIAKKHGASKTHMYDDAAKVHSSFEREKKNKPVSQKIKTHLVKPDSSGESKVRSFQATK